jgi:hypothetical protein
MKNTRILIALALILVVVVIAQSGVGAWTARLQADPKAVAPAPAGVGARPQGTVGGSPSVAVGSIGNCALIATYCVESAETGLTAKGITELPTGVTAPEGQKVVVTRLIEISSDDASTPSVEDIKFTLDPALVTGELVSYWDGTQWIELTIKDGVYTIPKGVALPLVIAVFTK